MEQAVQTASAHLPAPAPVGRRSPVSTRPLPSTSQKPIENQEHRRGRTLAVYYFLIDRSASSIQLIFIKKIYFIWNDPRRFKLNLRECLFSLSNSTQNSDGGGVIWIFGFVLGLFVFPFLTLQKFLIMCPKLTVTFCIFYSWST